MGIAQTQAELEKSIELSRKIGGVEKVVSYVRVKGESAVPKDFRVAQDDTSQTQTQVAENHSEERIASSGVQVQNLGDEPNSGSSFG